MNKLISIICVLMLVVGVTACSSAPEKYGNSPEQQRKNAKESHDELSTDINRGAR